MASIYKNADLNTRKTWFLITFFLVFVIAVGWFFSYVLDSSAILIFAVFLSITMSVGSYWFSDKLVLSMAHAVAIETGRDKNHAVIAVTQGLLNKLNKTELEGVLAHELSHIGNKDMLLGTVIVVLAGIVALLSNFFLRISFFGGRSRNSDDNKAGALLMILALVAAILAPIAATLIKLAISRKIEFLADADGALLTRYPEGLASALQKISSDVTPMKSANTATSHLYIDSPFNETQSQNWFVKLFSTHPPIEERLKALRDIDI